LKTGKNKKNHTTGFLTVDYPIIQVVNRICLSKANAAPPDVHSSDVVNTL